MCLNFAKQMKNESQRLDADKPIASASWWTQRSFKSCGPKAEGSDLDVGRLPHSRRTPQWCSLHRLVIRLARYPDCDAHHGATPEWMAN